MTTTWVKVAYGALLGLLLTITVASGVAAVTAGPRPPQPLGLNFDQLSVNSSQAETTRITKQIDGFYSDVTDFQRAYPDYQRDIFLWYAGIGILAAVVGTALPSVVNYLRFGFVLGGVMLIAAGAWFTIQPIPQIVPGGSSSLLGLLTAGTPSVLATTGRFLRFAVSIIGLLVLLFIGLWRLTEWQSSPRSIDMLQPSSSPGSPSMAPMAPVAPVPAPPGPVSAGGSVRWARPDEQPSGSSVEAAPLSPDTLPLVDQRPPSSEADPLDR